MTTELFLNPNIAYVILMAGFWLVVLSLVTPGTGIFELGAVFALLLAGWQIYFLEINWWALGILIVGVIPFLIAVRASGRLLYLGLSITALVVGSAYLFRGEGWLPGVNPFLALLVSGLTAGFMWLVTVKTLEAQSARPAHDPDRVIGATGLARTEVHEEGTVWVNQEEWSARSEEAIPAGAHVRVRSREGFVLIVEPLEASSAKS